MYVGNIPTIPDSKYSFVMLLNQYHSPSSVSWEYVVILNRPSHNGSSVHRIYDNPLIIMT